MKTNRLNKIAVIGAGVMGHGIAQIAAVSGFNVVVRDIDQAFLDKARGEIERSLRRFVERGRMTDDTAKGVLTRISMTLSLSEAVADADLVIEAVPEDLELKRKIWRDVSANARRDAILATNTSSMSINALSKAITSPERFVGMHFFNPPALMRLVEIIPGAKTSTETMEAVKALAEKTGKTPVVAKKDSPGFIVNRVLITYLNESVKLLESGRWTKEQIDSAMQLKAKMPLGPFMLADLIGLDIVYNILRVFEGSLGPSYRPAGPIEDLVKRNKLGRKTGEGFYGYKEQPKVTEQEGQGFDAKLLLKIIVSEAEKVVKEGVADRESVDTAMRLGANFPQGPFELAKTL